MTYRFDRFTRKLPSHEKVFMFALAVIMAFSSVSCRTRYIIRNVESMKMYLENAQQFVIDNTQSLEIVLNFQLQQDSVRFTIEEGSVRVFELSSHKMIEEIILNDCTYMDNEVRSAISELSRNLPEYSFININAVSVLILFRQNDNKNAEIFN